MYIFIYLQSETIGSEASVANTTIFETPTEASIFVYESVELEFSLATGTDDPVDPTEDEFACPIKILKGNDF